MPVSTETFRNMKTMNMVFAFSSVLLLLCFIGLVLDDTSREWREYQRDAKTWREAIYTAATQKAESPETVEKLQLYGMRLRQIEAEMASKSYTQLGDVAIGGDTEARSIADAEAESARLVQEIARIKLLADVAKGKRDVADQQIEIKKLDIAGATDDKKIATWQQELAALEKKRSDLNEQFWDYQPAIAQFGHLKSHIDSGLRAIKEDTEYKQLMRDRGDLNRKIESARKKLSEASPQGLHYIDEKLRNAPGLDWLNPSEKPYETATEKVQTDYNFVQVDTIDRCQSCHINIDDPLFDRDSNIAFVTRLLATHEQGDVSLIKKPVVMPEFWLEIAKKLDGSVSRQVSVVKEKVLSMLKEREEASGLPLPEGDLLVQVTYAASQSGNEKVTRETWYEPASVLGEQVKSLVLKHLEKTEGGEAVRDLKELYRKTLIKRYNETANPVKKLSESPVLLAHPGVEGLYVGPDSKHPMAVMACTVCHEGSGQETQFSHTAHTPRNVWVDEKTGTVIPNFLITEGDHKGKQKHDEHEAEVHDVAMSQDGVNVLSNKNAAPLSPDEIDLKLHHADYIVPGIAQDGQDIKGHAVKQADYWKKKFGWHKIKYMYWEKPMHALDYVQSSCIKCHTQVFDLKETAPKLYEGRKLFAEVGCVNCHAIDQIAGGGDIKQVGPSLVHVSKKLSPQMMANFIWSPKAFRPTTKMPHFFMLENNSSPIDILRTRVEVMAITWYLMQANPKSSNQAKHLEALLVKANESLKRATDEMAAIDKQLKEGKDAEGNDLTEEAKRQLTLQKQKTVGDQALANSEFRLVIEDMKKVLGESASEAEDPMQLLDLLWARVPDYEVKPLPVAQDHIEQLESKINTLKELQSKESGKVIKADLEVDIRKAKLAMSQWQKAPKGDVVAGRELFSKIGCQSCHSNLEEYGSGWLSKSLKEKAWFDVPSFAAELAKPVAERDVKSLASKLATHIQMPELADRWDQSLSETHLLELQQKIQSMIEKDLTSEETAAASLAFIAERRLRENWLSAAGELIYESLGYNQQHTLARIMMGDQLVTKGPELSAVGTKLLAGRAFKKTENGEPVKDENGQLIYEDKAYEEALAWTYDWLLEPRNYHSYTVMPSFRLSDRESLDLSAYLLTLRRPGSNSQDGAMPGDKGYEPYQPSAFGFNVAGSKEAFPIKNGSLADPESAQMLEEIILTLLSGKITRDMAKDQLLTEVVTADDVKDGFFAKENIGQLKWQSPQYRLYFTGRKMIQHYGCNGCHDINGFEDIGSACAKLDHWGAKDPHKLDFGYYYSAYDKQRKNPVSVWKAKHEGLSADAIDIGTKADDERIYEEVVGWEQFKKLDKRPWLYHKLHNTRIYNRGQTGMDGEKTETGFSIGKPYDKLKMPKFHLTDKEVRSIVTFVTGTRKPLVHADLQKTGTDAKMRQLKGMQVAAKYACFNCHDIDGNDVSVREYFNVFNEDGSLNYATLWDITPPRLVGQGAKTQPDWFVHFLQNVHQIRPVKGQGGQLEIRMPSFPMTNEEATAIADYFSGWSQKQAAEMKHFLEPITAYKQTQSSRQGVLELRLAKVRQSLANPELTSTSRNQLEKLARREEKALNSVRSFESQWFNGPTQKVKDALKKFKTFAYQMKLGDPPVKPGELDLLDGQLLPVKDSEKIESQESAIERWDQILSQAQFLQETWDIAYPYEAENAVPEMTADEFARGHALFNQLQCVMCHVLGDEDELKQIWLKMNPDKGLPIASLTPTPLADSQLAQVSDKENKQAFFVADDAVDEATFKKLMKDGQGVYMKVCVACHQPTGQGMAPMFPPLAGSDWATTKVPERLIRIVLHGIQGPIDINGKPFNSPAPMMPAQGAMLKDDEIAAALTFIRNSWGNKGSAVLPETVKTIREKEKTRTTMWTQKELLAIGDVATVSGEKVDDSTKAETALAAKETEPVMTDAVPQMWGAIHTAPNLKFVASRLQRKWTDKWLQNPKQIVPQSKMLPFWADGKARPDLNKAHYGHTGHEQRQLLLDFLYYAGHTYYTVNQEKLPGRTNKLIPVDQLAAIPAPVVKRPKGNISAPIMIGGGAGAKKKSLADLIDEAADDNARMAILMKEGGKIYNQICVACHQANGGGIAGQFPPLAGSDWVTTDVTSRITRIVLHGLQGPIEVNGQMYNSMMPAQGSLLSNAKVAAVITYIRNNWGNKGSMIDYKDVAKVRADSGARAPWTAAELLEIKE